MVTTPGWDGSPAASYDPMRADRDLVPQAIEETLRWATPHRLDGDARND
ncbi:MAG: hypothetical protein ACREOD_10635 [Candidatus Dormibacteria bacterium]